MLSTIKTNKQNIMISLQRILLHLITAASVAPCGGPKTSSSTSSIAQII